MSHYQLIFLSLVLTASVSNAQLPVVSDSPDILPGNSGTPERIASMSLCTDQLVYLLSSPETIATLSYLAADPGYSMIAQESKNFPLNYAQAEEILAVNPDLILTTQFSGTSTVNLLERLGHKVSTIGFPASYTDSYQQITEVAALLSQETAGMAMANELNRTINDHIQKLLPATRNKLAVFYSSNGYTFGSGTLRDDFLTQLGMRNVATEAGIVGVAQLPLETLLAARPDYLIVNALDYDNEQLAHHMLKHPALHKLLNKSQIIQLSDRPFQCSNPQLADSFIELEAQL